MLDVDPQGFDVMDRKLLEAVIHRFDGGPWGWTTLPPALAKSAGTIEDVIEPYLIQQGYLQRTPRGRIATLAAYRHLGVGVALKLAKATFPQAGVREQRAGSHSGNRLGGLPGTPQVTGVDGIDGFICQRAADTTGLPEADLIERNVQMSLNTIANVPGGFAMAHSDDAGGLHGNSGG
jgi:hypothetical protein